jgi:hypothetical protein
VGTLLSRGQHDVVRFYVNHLSPQEILSYLEECEWQGETHVLLTLLKRLETVADRFVLGFDITATGIGPRIGVECSFLSDSFQREERWQDLLDILVEQKLCLPERRDALLSYPGSEGEVSSSVMKPLPSASQHLSELMASSIIRYISHVKVVYETDHFMEAKAYPAVRLFEPTTTSFE